MAVRGITFSKQIVSSNDDAHIYGVLLNGRNGRTKGCKMTFGTDDIYISEGYFLAASRLIEISSIETIATPIVATTTYCRLVFELDMSKANTNSEFTQGYFKILTSASDYPGIVQEDIENGGNVYQLPFARFIKTVNGISSFVSDLETVGFADKNKTIYVDASGNDASADGTTTHPFKTIQAAINTIPKYLAGHTITIDVGFGVYNERLIVENFSSGKIIIGNPGNVFTIQGIEIINCTCVETNIYQIEYNQTGSKGLFDVSGGSSVLIKSDMIIDGVNQSGTGFRAIDNSSVAVDTNIVITINNCGGAVSAQKCSFVTLDTLTGDNNTFGMMAYQGSIISYKTDTLKKMWSNDANSGGLVLTGSNSTNLSGATIEL